MTAVQFNQLGCPSNTPYELEVKNYGVSDIAAGIIVTLDTTNIQAPNGTPPGVVLPTDNTTTVLGVTTMIIAAGKMGKIRMDGLCVCTSSAALGTANTVLMTDSAGKVLAWTTGHVPVGVNISLASATGESVLVKFYGGHPVTSSS